MKYVRSTGVLNYSVWAALLNLNSGMRPRRKLVLSLVLLLALMAGLSARISRRKPADDYGRLMKTQIARSNNIRRQPPPVIATPVTEQTSADPLLIAPAAREQEFL